MKQQHKSIVLLVLLSLALTACGDKKAETVADAAPAVKVNGQAISDAEFQLKAGMHTEGAEKKHPISAQAMESTLTMELLRQAAVESKLDKDEAIRARMAVSMRAILSTAYLERLIASVAKPTAADISAFYNQHPERFSDRKLLTLKEVAIQPGAGKEAEIQAALGKLKNVADFEKWLLANKIAFNSAPITNTSDQITEEAAKKLKDVPVGGSVMMSSGDATHVVFVLDAQPQPLALEQASPTISNMLLEKGRKDAIDKVIKSLRDKAKIEFVAPYTEKGLPMVAAE